MAFNNYKKTIAAGASSASDILVREATTTDVIIGLNIANTHATATATVKVEVGTTSLLENAKIPSGGAIKVKKDSGTADVIVSLLTDVA